MGKGLKSHELMAVSPLGTKIAFGGTGGYVHVVCGVQKTPMLDVKMNTAVRYTSIILLHSPIFLYFNSYMRSYIFDINYNLCVHVTHRSIAFLDEERLISSGLDADIYIWDLRHQGRCLGKFHHDDGSCSSSIAYHSSGYVAVGAESGVVSLYDTSSSILSGISSEMPIKVFNLIIDML